MFILRKEVSEKIQNTMIDIVTAATLTFWAGHIIKAFVPGTHVSSLVAFALVASAAKKVMGPKFNDNVQTDRLTLEGLSALTGFAVCAVFGAQVYLPSILALAALGMAVNLAQTKLTWAI